MRYTSLFIVGFITICQSANCYKILCAYPTVSRSHFIVVDALLRGLAEKGHNVTVISAFPPEPAIPNYRHITHALNTRYQAVMKQFAANPGRVTTMFKMIPFVMETLLQDSESMLTNPEVRKLMNEETFDLVIFEVMGASHMGLAAHFKCPYVLFSTIKTSYRFLEVVGNPLALSYVSHPIYKLPEPMTFKYRLLNFIIYLFERLISTIYLTTFEDFHAKHFPQPYPTLDAITNNVSAIFAVQHFSQGGVMPLVPGIIEVSGIQMKTKSSPLPDELQKWMDDSTNGVIFFSMGSNVKTADIPADKLHSILGAFGKLQMNVLWKSETSEISGLPNNVRIEKWISQIDVLQHANLKLFITHGGLGSVSEAKFYGIPLVVIPMFADQMSNGELVKKEEWGVTLQFLDLDENTLISSIKEVTSNPKYIAKAKYEAMLYRDRPLSPLDNGIYWIEYIIRHNGAPHIRSNARTLNFLQLHSLDVMGFLAAIIILFNLVFATGVRYMWRKIFKARKQKQT